MLKRIEDLPSGIVGFEAHGKVTREDYEKVLNPAVEEAYRNHRRIRFLYRLGPEFEGFTAGAAWEDFQVGRKYLSLFERCAVVTDRDWIWNASQLMAPLVPTPFKAFKDADFKKAVEWLNYPLTSHVSPKFVQEKGLLIVEVTGPLGKGDFEALSAEVDPWIEKHHSLKGIIVHANKFPGWENLGSFFKHIEFVGEHHRKVKRIALAADGILPEMIPRIANHFVEAELKHFSYGDLEQAITWAAE